MIGANRAILNQMTAMESKAVGFAPTKPTALDSVLLDYLQVENFYFSPCKVK